ncbi:MAG: class I SAM-dependent methyltransferase [Candidatus Tectomicrobia bacterium]|nr:class I SAM-dependent methyltransferase [Candidatus Tectomicrobia bacterium]
MGPSSANVAPSHQGAPPQTPPRNKAEGRVVADLIALRRAANLSGVRFTSHRKLWGGTVILLKTILRRLLTPILERQSAYNHTNAQLVADLHDQISLLKHELNVLRQQHVEALYRQHPHLVPQRNELEPQLDQPLAERLQQEFDLQELQKNWNAFGTTDPFWAILTWPDKQGNRWDPDEFFALGRAEIDMIMTHVTSLNLPLPRRKALDFGCGVGRITQALAAYFDEVSGVDIAPAMVELARTYNRHGRRCQYFVNDTNKLALFENDTFDLIYSIITLQHIKPPYIRDYLKEFLRILTPGGLLVFQVPSEPVPELRPTPGQPGESDAFTHEVYPQHQPYMEMHSIPQDEVLAWLLRHGAKILQVMDDTSAGPTWVSFRYFVTKP